MSLTLSRTARGSHPLHFFLLAGSTCYFVSGFLTDWLYYATHEIQWKNFASWLIMGGLILGGLALLWAAIELARANENKGRRIAYAGLLLVSWVLSFINELIHAKNAWASMPEGLIISAIVAILMLVAAWFGLSTLRHGGRWA